MCSGNPMIFLLPPCPTDENMGVPNQKRHNFWEICHPLTKILGTSWVLRIVEKHQVCAFEFMWHVSSSNWQCFPRSNRSELLKCLEPLFSIHNPYLVPHLCYPQFYDLPSCKQKMCLHPLDVWSGTLPGHKGATTSVRSRRPVEQCRLGWLGTMDMIHMSSKVHIYIHINIYTYSYASISFHVINLLYLFLWRCLASSASGQKKHLWGRWISNLNVTFSKRKLMHLPLIAGGLMPDWHQYIERRCPGWRALQCSDCHLCHHPGWGTWR